MATLVTLPPHLIERIRLFLDVELPIQEDIRISLEAATSEARLSDSDMRSPTPIASEVQLSGDTDLDRDESRHDHSDQRDHRSEMRDLEDEIAPPTIDIDLVERLSRWATSDLGEAASRAKGLDPSQYLIVSLLAGTQIYVPPKQRALLLSAENPDKPSPYLPSYLSPTPPSFAQEYRPLAAQLSTILNILFSIFGSAAAVYVAAVTGAGYSRETAVILAILAGVIVGVADGVVVWVYVDRLDRGRREARERGVEMSKGSGRLDGDRGTRVDGGDEPKGKDEDRRSGEGVMPEKREVRLRRRALRDEARQDEP